MDLYKNPHRKLWVSEFSSKKSTQETEYLNFHLENPHKKLWVHGFHCRNFT